MEEEKKIKEIITAKQSNREYFDTNFLLQKIESDVGQLIRDLYGEDFQVQLDLAPENMGSNFAFTTFQLSKKIKKNPEDVALEISEKINSEGMHNINKAKATGAYVNLEPSGSLFSDVITLVKDYKEKFGQMDTNQNKLIWMEYSQPNIAKPFGVGHLRSTIIGEALARIYEATGASVIRHNYLGDWGTQFGKLIFAYKNWAKNPNPSIKELKDLYVEFHEKAETDPSLEDEARKISKELEDGNEEYLSLWRKFKEISIKEFEDTYQKLGVNFDTWLGESFFNDKINAVVKDAQDVGIAKEGEAGALVVDLGENIPTFVLKRGDGAGVYITRDLAALKFRSEVSGAATIIYVVDQRQSLHFKQLFGAAFKLGYLKTEAKYIPFGLLLSDGEAMSTRKGTLVELDELLNQSMSKARTIIKDKNSSLSEQETDSISEIVGIGAVIYNDLHQFREKNISFDWKKMLDFEGSSAAYLQYTYVRINSILNKIESNVELQDYTYEKDIEMGLAKKILFFPSIIWKAQKLDAPHLIATYLEELAQIFNSFYSQVQVVATEDPKLKESRKMLIWSVATVIKNGLNLLNVKVPNKM